jgi:hypothetical protein
MLPRLRKSEGRKTNRLVKGNFSQVTEREPQEDDVREPFKGVDKNLPDQLERRSIPLDKQAKETANKRENYGHENHEQNPGKNITRS